MSRNNGWKKIISTSALCAALLLAGCSGPHQLKAGPIFFPPPPNYPRVQFLMGISSSSDLETDDAAYSLFMVGKQQQDKIIPIVKPFGITTHGSKVYLSDLSAGKIIVIDFAKNSLEPLKGEFGAGNVKKPAGIAVDKAGNLFVADTQRKEILQYDPEGNFVQAYGKDLELKPSDVEVTADNLYILDIGSNSIKVVNRATGAKENEFGKGSSTAESLGMPIGMTLAQDKYLLVTNAGTGKVMKFDTDGHLLSSFGEKGDSYGQFARPRGIATDREGILYVVDAALQNVQMFNEKGQILMFFGDPGLKTGSLNLPADIAVSYDNLEYFQKLAAPSFILDRVLFVTNQFGNAKLSVYGVGRQKGIDYDKAYEEIKKDHEKLIKAPKKD